MRIKLMDIQRNPALICRHDLPYTLTIKIQGTDSEVKKAQEKVMEILKGFGN
jgi:hypothetical protein